MRPASDPIETMRPYPRLIIGSSTARTVLMNPHVSIAISRSHSLRGFSMNRRSIVHPAQFTRTWTPPIELSANSTVEETDSQFVTSVWRATMVPEGASDSTLRACSSSTSAITTRAPSLAKPKVMARPRFEAPPVTMTTFPLSPRSIAGSLIGEDQGARAPWSVVRLLLGFGFPVAVQRAHERRGQAFQRAPAACHQDLRHDVELAFGKRVGDGHRGRRRRAQARDLSLIALRLGEAERFH